MTFEEKWNHVARRLFVFFTREGVFNFSLLLLSPLGRVDFASNASKREVSLFKKVASVYIACVTDLYRLDFHFIPSSHFTSAADAPSPSDFVCHLSRFIGRACPKGESKEWRFTRFIGRACPEGESKEWRFTRFIGRACPKGESKEWRFTRFIGRVYLKCKSKFGEINVF